LPIDAAACVNVGHDVVPLRRTFGWGADVFSQAPRPTQEEEHCWVAAVREGDEAAFEQVFLAYYDRLQAYAERYVQRPDVAEEVVENIFVRLWEQREQWEIRQSLKSYLYAAVRNQALMWIDHQRIVRRAQEAGMREQRSPGMGQARPTAEEELQAAELAAAARAAVERLPNRAREAYVLSRQHGLSYAEIAEAMGISSKTVEIHLGRALKALREDLSAFLQ
jgi:RNA polymerase sigma-70 factor (ECF subfamily)